jgi:hypothetical protein
MNRWPQSFGSLVRFEGLPGEFSQLLELGEPAIRYLTEIVHRRPRQWYEDVDRLHQILQSHGPEVLRRAMEEGLKQQIYGAFYVERSLQPGLSFPQVAQ